jgi:hypothetical protein
MKKLYIAYDSRAIDGTEKATVLDTIYNAKNDDDAISIASTTLRGRDWYLYSYDVDEDAQGSNEQFVSSYMTQFTLTGDTGARKR